MPVHKAISTSPSGESPPDGLTVTTENTMTDDQPLLPEHAAEKPTDSASECPKTNADKPIFIITGLSGAGKSTVLHVFEDMRLFTADGVPPELMPEMVRLLQSSSVEPSHGIARFRSAAQRVHGRT